MTLYRKAGGEANLELVDATDPARLHAKFMRYVLGQ
jgi:hypothetical protein